MGVVVGGLNRASERGADAERGEIRSAHRLADHHLRHGRRREAANGRGGRGQVRERRLRRLQIAEVRLRHHSRHQPSAVRRDDDREAIGIADALAAQEHAVDNRIHGGRDRDAGGERQDRERREQGSRAEAPQGEPDVVGHAEPRVARPGSTETALLRPPQSRPKIKVWWGPDGSRNRSLRRRRDGASRRADGPETLSEAKGIWTRCVRVGTPLRRGSANSTIYVPPIERPVRIVSQDRPTMADQYGGPGPPDEGRRAAARTRANPVSRALKSSGTYKPLPAVGTPRPFR